MLKENVHPSSSSSSKPSRIAHHGHALTDFADVGRAENRRALEDTQEVAKDVRQALKTTAMQTTLEVIRQTDQTIPTLPSLCSQCCSFKIEAHERL